MSQITATIETISYLTILKRTPEEITLKVECPKCHVQLEKTFNYSADNSYQCICGKFSFQLASAKTIQIKNGGA